MKVERALSASLPATEPPCLVAPEGFLGAYRRAAKEPATSVVLADLLALIGYDAEPAVIERWSLQKRVEAEVHAVNVHLRASDNVMRKHPRPSWMPEPWLGEPSSSGQPIDTSPVWIGPSGTVLP